MIRGDGSAGWFAKKADGTFKTPSGSLTVLTQNANGSYSLSHPSGNVDQFAASGLLTSHHDRHRNQKTYTYTDADGDTALDELSQITDVFGRSTTYGYSGGLLSSVTDSAGRAITYQYDTNDFLTSITQPDPDGIGPKTAPVSTFSHDTAGRVTAMTDPLGTVTSYVYNFAGRIESITTGGQTQEIAARDVQGLVDLSVSGYGALNKAAATYLTQIGTAISTDKLGHDTTYGLDKFGYTTSKVDALGQQWTFDRNTLGQIITSTGPDPDGTGPLTAPQTQYQYDPVLGKVTLITNPDSSTVSFTYETSFAQLTSVTDELGRVTKYDIDVATGDVREVRHVVGVDDRSSIETDDVVTSYTYSNAMGSLPAGLVLSEIDPVGSVTQYTYNSDPLNQSFGRLASVTSATGTALAATVSYEYDAAGNVTAVVNELGQRTQYDYDALDRLVALTLPDPDRTGPLNSPVYSYNYDAAGQLVSETDPLSRVTSYAYDNHGSLISVTRPDQNADSVATVSSYAYDAAGRLSTSTDPLGRVTAYAYDWVGQLTQVTAPDPDGTGPLAAPVAQFAYDALGRLTRTTDPLGNATQYEYDARDRRIKVIAPDPDGTGPLTAPETGFQYDVAGQLKVLTDPLRRATSYAYDALARLLTLTLPDPDGSGALTAPVYSYSYDKAGRTLSNTDPRGNTTSYAYDALGRTTSLNAPDPDGSGPLAAPVTTYGYDLADQLTSVTDPLSRVTAYQYDHLGRLTKETAPDPDGAGAQTSPVTRYEYDAVGNLTAEEDALAQRTTYAYNPLNWRVSSTDARSGVTSLAYDDAGNLLSLTDPAGNATSWAYDGLDRATQETDELLASRYFSFDAAGRLVSRTDRNGRESEFDYDGLNRRTQERWLDSSGLTTRTLAYSYDAASQLTSASDPVASYNYKLRWARASYADLKGSNGADWNDHYGAKL